jgi:uncharacterized integral membrane protein
VTLPQYMIIWSFVWTLTVVTRLSRHTAHIQRAASWCRLWSWFFSKTMRDIPSFQQKMWWIYSLRLLWNLAVTSYCRVIPSSSSSPPAALGRWSLITIIIVIFIIIIIYIYMSLQASTLHFVTGKLDFKETSQGRCQSGNLIAAFWGVYEVSDTKWSESIASLAMPKTSNK